MVQMLREGYEDLVGFVDLTILGLIIQSSSGFYLNMTRNYGTSLKSKVL